MIIRDSIWQKRLDAEVKKFLKKPAIKLNGNKQLLPIAAGVYMFSSEDDTECYYVGKAGDIQGRIFNGHLTRSKRKDRVGNLRDYYYKAPLKNSLLGWSNAGTSEENPECSYEDQAHDLLLNKLNFRWVEIGNSRFRGMFEYYLTSILNAKHSIDKDV
ncbi:hypothetical protein [Paenibacillus macquariensis]|uniref:GIY-YIG domain-containing protein n=1 Tax=Paenibacillus macquariensis TaxID=948756 RepID=A0ABY1JKG1_9BACL|nr:hypothetical protein [Paenibacillus macquariensis]MEC0089913.1 hypothetical protein [Paenibacillus macquariensis]OAB31195.1 hypothetical protein PMSM_20975 [Paenibacillus macquariensis subsp. macquariensis]SIQ34154.1 hypothetical protein SAMN05421578_101299 [Paenibacillus macquariensis]